MFDTYIRYRDLQRVIKLIRKDYPDIKLRTDAKRNDQKNSSDPWRPERQEISAGTSRDNPPWLSVVGLAHELGHCISVRSGKNHVTMGEYMVYVLRKDGGSEIGRAHV